MFCVFRVSERTHVSFNSSPLKNYANWQIFLIMTGSDIKGNLHRLVITVVCFGWNFLVLEWQFTGDYWLYGVTVVGFPVGSFLNNHYVGYKFRIFFLLVLISFWKAGYG